MRFTPKTEKELAEEGLLKPDNYDFQAVDAFDKTSKSGNAMIELKLHVFGKDGSTHYITDYLLEAMGFKLRHFCDGAGMLAKYEVGEITAIDCKGKTGLAFIGIQKDKNGVYPDKNVVKDYHKSEDIVGGNASEDDVPF